MGGEMMAAPAPATAKPAPAWTAPGLPAPGSFFENMSANAQLDGTGKFVALTFDDGPAPHTPQVLEVLRFFNVKATFFMLSDQVPSRADLVRQMVAEGMHVAAHSRSHPHLRKVDAAGQRDQIVGSADVIDSVAGAGTVKCLRPPYGEYDQTTLDIDTQRGLATAMWSVDSLDWKKPGFPAIVNRVLGGVRDRSVVLFHDGGGDRSQTVEALKWIIPALLSQGYQFLPIC
jgi:peptidoglycan/xylan/chitin deacetylase (PgdA/CDA1 family)